MHYISVIIPALNDAEMLRTCLAALNSQSRAADEIVVVDNGSTDDTAAVALAGGARVIAEPQRGIFPATAAGFDAAKGDILARLDADSVPSPDWLERVSAAFEADAALTALTGPGAFYGSNRLVHWLGRHLYIGGYFWFIGLILGHPPMFGSNLALRSTAWSRLRLTVHRNRADIHDDLDLSYHVTPDMIVRFDPKLVVGISARPFGSWTALRRRLTWAFGTMALNGREISAARRRSARKAYSRDRARARTQARA
jgi:glycosyltransferase involved in cell wall biosynthesis